MCSLLICVSSISSINLKSLFGSLLDKEPNVTLYVVTTTCAYIYLRQGRNNVGAGLGRFSRVQIRRIHRHDTRVSNLKPHITVQCKATENDFKISNRKYVAQGSRHNPDKKDKMSLRSHFSLIKRHLLHLSHNLECSVLYELKK